MDKRSYTAFASQQIEIEARASHDPLAAISSAEDARPIAAAVNGGHRALSQRDGWRAICAPDAPSTTRRPEPTAGGGVTGELTTNGVGLPALGKDEEPGVGNQALA
jgi:hypothetical protein